MNMSGGVISGNWTNESNGHDGGGVFVNNGTLRLSGNGYITNNYKSLSSGGQSDSNNTHGGGGVVLSGSTAMYMTGGYVTGNRSEEAGGGIYAGHWGESVRFSMTGGIIASNYAHYGEGGGLRVAGGTNAVIDASSGGRIYITNNRTGYNKDWGGGGIFIQEDGYLNIRDVVITNNTADGLGGGVAGCPTGDVTSDPVNDGGAAMFGNTANVEWDEHFRSQFNYKDFDRAVYDKALKNIENKADIAKDYFGSGKSSISEDMLGGGKEAWKVPTWYQVHIQEENTAILVDGHTWSFNADVTFATLTSDASGADRQKAINAARVFISGNYSYTHGGGIMSNGTLDMGKRDEKTKSASLTLQATKALLDASGETKELAEDQFSFVLLNAEPTWDAAAGKYTYETENVVKRAGNDADGNITFGSISFLDEGTYTYYLVEEEVTDTSITQDSALYQIEVKVKEEESQSEDTRTYTYKIDSITVTKGEDTWKTENINQQSYTYTVLKSVDTATFVNHDVPSYSLPSTGGAGTTPYTTGGLLLMVSASALLLYNHQKRRKEAHASS